MTYYLIFIDIHVTLLEEKHIYDILFDIHIYDVTLLEEKHVT